MPRTPEFNRDNVIDTARDVFWERGYTQTSVSDLVRATGLKPGSLYCAFGSKKGLFLEVLDTYERRFIERLEAAGRHPSGALAGFIDLLDEAIDDAVLGRDRRGCLAVNAMLEMAGHDPDIEARIVRHNAGTRTAIASLVRIAQAEGDIDAERDPDDVAAFILNSVWGLRVMCRAENNPHMLNAVAAGILAGVGNRQQKARVRVTPAL